MAKNSWEVDRDVVPEGDRDSFDSMCRLLDSPMKAITRDKFSGVSLLSLQRDYYVKIFTGHGEHLKRLLGISRFQRELRNLRYFAELGLTTPQIAASGGRASLGYVRSGVLVTLGVEGALSLEQLIAGGDFYAGGRQRVRGLLDQLADAFATLHRNGFIHRDLKARNILVQGYGQHCRLYFFDCPSGYHPPKLLMADNVARDLAYLERSLREHVQRADLMYLFKKYRGTDKLDAEDKKLARAVLNYYRDRRMSKGRKLRQARHEAERAAENSDSGR